ncbi:MAG: dihydroorotate dehydrogenase electron transfer subunit [Akkermansiaceae bacterium]|nr:dihydroorotate dehydrogenase electron transfer subunit [Armatimonadota bacterium]
MIQKILAPIVRNEKLSAPGHHVLTFHAPDLARAARPGHFIAVHADTGAQILRRPFSVYTTDAETGNCSILFSVYGPSTSMMAKYAPGDLLDLIGPLGGKVFAADSRPAARHIMVGGGYGVPPLAFLTRQILAADRGATVLFVNGARTRDFLVGTDGLDDIGATLLPATDDGSHGYKGRVTGVLEPLLTVAGRPPTAIYTCGPTPMMKAVAEMAMAFDVPCQASLEVFMPCGIGICMGCAIPTPDGRYLRGCVEGPVFEAREIVWK